MENTISTILSGDSKFDLAVSCGRRLVLDRGSIRHVQNLKKLNSLDAPADEIVSILHELADIERGSHSHISLSKDFLEEFADK